MFLIIDMAKYLQQTENTEVSFFVKGTIEHPLVLSTLLSRGVPVHFSVRGSSMFPFVRNNDLLQVSPVDQRKISVGDVVVVKSMDEKRILVHRVIGRKKRGFILKGDNRYRNMDGLVLPQYVIGRVIRIKRGDKIIVFGLGLEKYLIAFCSRLLGSKVFSLLQVPFLKVWHSVFK